MPEKEYSAQGYIVIAAAVTAENKCNEAMSLAAAGCSKMICLTHATTNRGG